jgi:iron complex transport system substrate-binding protein
MFPKIKKLLLLFTAIALLIGGCTAVGTSKPANIEVVDGLGRTVSLSSVPQKIISLAPSNTELLFAIGAGQQVVGRDEFSDFPDEAKAIASGGGSMGKYSLEQITALQPDLIIAAEINSPELVQSIESLGFKVYYLSNPKDLDGLYENIMIIGELSGRDKEAAELIDSLKERVKKVQDRKLAESSPVKVFYELDGSDPTKPWTAGKGSFIDVLLSLAGAVNVANDAGEGWIQYSQEALIVANPDVILLGDAVYGVTADSVASRAGWDDLAAIQNGHIYAFDDNLVSRPGPRLVDGLEELVRLLGQ